MAHVLIMPRQGNTVESCIITNWKVNEGETVTPDTPICDVETDKATFEVPAGAAGTVLKLLHSSGDDVPVLQPIAVIGAAGENWQAAVSSGNVSHGAAQEKKVSVPDNKVSVPGTAPPQEINAERVSPRARILAEKKCVSLEMVSGTGPEG
jgi:pyruvate dehydrogenase E2 component (dihydrolipoamide acetyltransferase)